MRVTFVGRNRQNRASGNLFACFRMSCSSFNEDNLKAGFRPLFLNSERSRLEIKR